MEKSKMWKHNGGHSNLNRLLLLLFLAGLQPALSTDGEQPEPHDNDGGINVSIDGPNYITVGVPSTVECVANCTNCIYSMSLDGERIQGDDNVLFFVINVWMARMTVSCTVTNEDTKLNGTATAVIQVLAGPSNISISGPSLVNPTVNHTYSCHAYCQPSCIYSWKLDNSPWISGLGNVVTVVPWASGNSKTLICKASNTVSGMFIAAIKKMDAIFGPSDVQIKGPDIIKIAEKYTFVCTAQCVPSCRYISSVDTHTVRGNVIDITVDHPLKSVNLKCEAQNTASRKTAIALKTVQIQDNPNLSARPEATSAALLLAFIISGTVLL